MATPAFQTSPNEGYMGVIVDSAASGFSQLSPHLAVGEEAGETGSPVCAHHQHQALLLRTVGESRPSLGITPPTSRRLGVMQHRS